MKIVALQAENIKRLTAVEIRPDGAAVIIGGKNGAGKSSVLDAIAYALGGVKLCPAEPIRRGEESASVTVDLGEIVVERRFTPSGSTLVVKNADGFRAASPQKVLDKLIGRLTFDPLEFVTMKPEKRLEIVKEIAGLDFSDMDADRAKWYVERTDVNRDAKRLEARLAAIPKEDAPAEEASASALMERLNAARKRRDVYSDLQMRHVNHGKRVEQIDKEIAALREDRMELTDLMEEIKAAINDPANKPPGDEDVAAIEEQIKTADETNAKIRRQKERAELAVELEAFEEEAENLTLAIEGIDEKKQDAIAEAKLPVEGLGFDDAGVTLEGIPFEQASSAEQLKTSVAMGLAMNPKLRVILIRDGSLLDADNLKLIAEMAETHDAQVWIERVGNGAEASVIIENGAVAAPSEP